MRDFRDAKAMARSLRDGLAAKSIDVTHSESLELIAKAFGFDDWNVLSAKIEAEASPATQGSHAKIELSPPVPMLRIFDVEKAKQFYLGILGFKLDWEHRFGEGFPLYAQVTRAGVTLHLTEHAGDCTPGSSFIVNMRGLAEFHRELQARGSKPDITEGAGNRDVLELWDPFGNRLRFSQPKAGRFDFQQAGYSTP